MATYTSTNVRDKTGVTAPTAAGQVLVAYAEVVCTAALSTSDTAQFFYLPAGARIVGAILESTDMDTGGPTITINVGDAGSAARLFSASTVAQAGTLSSAIATTGMGYTYTAKTLITAVAQANATTPAAGTLSLTVYYTVA
jgi:hypothetical protein